MNTEEAIAKILAEPDSNCIDAVSRVVAAGMIADATNRLADQKKRQMDMQETLMERFGPMLDIYVDMIAKMGPAVDASVQMVQDEIKRDQEGELWKHGRTEDDED